MTKKVLCIILSVIIVLSSFSADVYACGNDNGNNRIVYGGDIYWIMTDLSDEDYTDNENFDEEGDNGSEEYQDESADLGNAGELEKGNSEEEYIAGGLNKDNIYESFTTLDGGVISSTSSGRPKLLIFFSVRCCNDRTTFSRISRTINSYKGIDLYAIEAKCTSKSEVSDFKSQYGCDDIIFSYDTSYGNTDSMWRYATMAGKYNCVTFPVICYIDASNRFQHMTTGVTTSEAILSNIRTYCGYNAQLVPTYPTCPVPEQTPEQVPETPEQIPEQIPEQVPETPEQMPEQIPEQVPETPEQMPEQIPDYTPEQVPEQVPETPEQIPEQVPETPEQIPEQSQPAKPDSYTYNVSYNAIGAYGTLPDSAEYKNDQVYEMPWPNLVKEGHRFKGWCTDSAGNGEIYAPGTTVKNLIEENGQVKLYAVWEKMSSTERNFASEVVNIVNKNRRENGVEAVSVNPVLSAVAQERAYEISALFSHDRPDGSSCFNLFTDAGYIYSYSGENIAYGQNTPDFVMDRWMNSEGHRRNILNGNFTEIGVGCCYLNGRYYWVQCFGTKRMQ